MVLLLNVIYTQIFFTICRSHYTTETAHKWLTLTSCLSALRLRGTNLTSEWLAWQSGTSELSVHALASRRKAATLNTARPINAVEEFVCRLYVHLRKPPYVCCSTVSFVSLEWPTCVSLNKVTWFYTVSSASILKENMMGKYFLLLMRQSVAQL